MKKIVALLCLIVLAFTRLFAQFGIDFSKMRCTYDLNYVPDSTNPQDKHEERMLLFISDSSSLFESEGQWVNDSSKGTKYLASNFRFRIFKSGGGNIKDLEEIEANHFVYKEPKPIDWRVMEETSNINGYVCQKAMCKFGGREWTAWFTTDVPISDGPYKFCGLPGLVVEINDTQNYFSFRLVRCESKTEKISTENNWDSSYTLLDASKKKYFMVLNEYRHDPMPFVKQRIHIISGEDAITQRIKERIRTNNNFIERSPE